MSHNRRCVKFGNTELVPLPNTWRRHWIYVVSDESNRVAKVGVTDDPSSRIGSIRTRAKVSASVEQCAAHLGMARPSGLCVRRLWRLPVQLPYRQRYVVERAVHAALRASGLFCRGEWYVISDLAAVANLIGAAVTATAGFEIEAVTVSA